MPGAKRKRKGPGRPPLMGHPVELSNFLIDRPVLGALRKYAKKSGVSVSQVIRTAIDNLLAQTA